jgi:hypothetical protein
VQAVLVSAEWYILIHASGLKQSSIAQLQFECSTIWSKQLIFILHIIPSSGSDSLQQTIEKKNVFVISNISVLQRVLT